MVFRVIPTIQLNDGHAIPQLGFSVFKVDPAKTAAVTRHALDAGYVSRIAEAVDRTPEPDTFDRI